MTYDVWFLESNISDPRDCTLYYIQNFWIIHIDTSTGEGPYVKPQVSRLDFQNAGWTNKH